MSLTAELRTALLLCLVFLAISSFGGASIAHAQPEAGIERAAAPAGEADATAGDASAPSATGTGAGATPALPPASIGFFIPRRRGISWDAELEAGLRLVRSDDLDVSALLGRLKLGVLLVREPLYLSVTATGELGGMASAGIGAEVQLTHSWAGLWGHLGVTFTGDDTAVVRTAVGFTLFGLEWQRELDSSDVVGDALFLNVRVPVGIIYVLLNWQPKMPAAVVMPRH